MSSDRGEVMDSDEELDVPLQEASELEDEDVDKDDVECDAEGDAEDDAEDDEGVSDSDEMSIQYYFNHNIFSTLFGHRALPETPQPVATKDILGEPIAQQLKSASWSSASTPKTKNIVNNISRMLQQRELNFKCPFSSQDKVRTLQQARYIPSHSTLRFQYDHQVFCGQYSQDGSVYMSACQDRHIRLYNTQTWKETKDILARDIGWSIIDTDYSPDQRWLIYSSWSECVHLCNIQGDFEIHDALDFAPGSQRFCLFSIKFSPDSNEILGGSSDRNLYIYDLDRKERTVKVEAHQDDINTVCYLDSSGQTLISGSDDDMVKVWDRRMLGAAGGCGGSSGCVGLLPGHEQGITHVSPKGDGRYVISNGKDQTIKLWDVRSMKSPSSASSGAGRGRRWDYRTGIGMGAAYQSSSNRGVTDVSVMTYKGHKVLQTLIRAYFSPSYTTGQKYIYTGSYDGTVYVYDVLTGDLEAKLKAHRAIIRDLSWHPYDTSIVTTSWDGAVLQWTIEDDPLIGVVEKAKQPTRRRVREYY